MRDPLCLGPPTARFRGACLFGSGMRKKRFTRQRPSRTRPTRSACLKQAPSQPPGAARGPTSRHEAFGQRLPGGSLVAATVPDMMRDADSQPGRNESRSAEVRVTIREHLRSKKRRGSTAIYVGMIVFAAGAILAGYHRSLPLLGLVGLAIALVGLFHLMGIQCPACGNRLGTLLASEGMSFSISPELRVCPFCSTELDAPLSDPRPV